MVVMPKCQQPQNENVINGKEAGMFSQCLPKLREQFQIRYHYTRHDSDLKGMDHGPGFMVLILQVQECA